MDKKGTIKIKFESLFPNIIFLTTTTRKPDLQVTCIKAAIYPE